MEACARRRCHVSAHPEAEAAGETGERGGEATGLLRPRGAKRLRPKGQKRHHGLAICFAHQHFSPLPWHTVWEVIFRDIPLTSPRCQRACGLLRLGCRFSPAGFRGRENVSPWGLGRRGLCPGVVTRSEQLFSKAAPGTALNRACLRADTCTSAPGDGSYRSRKSSRGGRGEGKSLPDIPAQRTAE